MVDAVNNPDLRAHVTRVGFDLSLGRTHIAALVWLNECLAQNLYLSTQTSPLRAFSHFATGARGLRERGLVEHDSIAAHRPGRRASMRRIWKITKAGRAVITLLREAGIYDEYAAAIPTQTRIIDDGHGRRLGIVDRNTA